jgi:hypothetical protein
MDNKCAGWSYSGHLKNYKNWNFSRTIKMDFIEQYFSRSQEIIGDRTQTEIRYDNEVVRWLRKGKEIKKAIKKANKKYPNEALKLDGSEINDVTSYYDYLLEHENIIRKISH